MLLLNKIKNRSKMKAAARLPLVPKMLHSLRHSTYNSTSTPQNGNFTVTVIGAANEVGSNVSLLLRENPMLKVLNLYDFDSKMLGFEDEMFAERRGPKVNAYNGDKGLGEAVHEADLILMVASNATKASSKYELARLNSIPVEKLCRSVRHYNRKAYLAIATEPINIMVPFAYHVLSKYSHSHFDSFSPYKLLGPTGVNEIKVRKVVADYLGKKSSDIPNIPVIGGHSPDTIVPLFSNIKVNPNLTPEDVYVLTIKARRSDSEDESLSYVPSVNSPLSIAQSLSDFTNNILKALSGEKVEISCYMANPHFGTRFLSGPVIIGPKEELALPKQFKMSYEERNLLDDAIKRLQDDVYFAETLLKNDVAGLRLS